MVIGVGVVKDLKILFFDEILNAMDNILQESKLILL